MSFINTANSWLNILLIRSGDIHPHPGQTHNHFSFCHWNLNGLMAHDKLKITLLEAYNTIFNYDVSAISESQLRSSVENTEIHIEGFSHEVFQKEHSDDKCKGRVCLYYKENLPITREQNLEIIDKTIVCKINVRRKKAYFVVVCRSPSQTDDEFDLFIDRLDLTIENIQANA